MNGFSFLQPKFIKCLSQPEDLVAKLDEAHKYWDTNLYAKYVTNICRKLKIILVASEMKFKWFQPIMQTYYKEYTVTSDTFLNGNYGRNICTNFCQNLPSGREEVKKCEKVMNRCNATSNSISRYG